jgi:hypothetical protein
MIETRELEVENVIESKSDQRMVVEFNPCAGSFIKPTSKDMYLGIECGTFPTIPAVAF